MVAEVELSQNTSSRSNKLLPSLANLYDSARAILNARKPSQSVNPRKEGAA